jgi:hypothetical protein
MLVGLFVLQCVISSPFSILTKRVKYYLLFMHTITPKLFNGE